MEGFCCTLFSMSLAAALTALGVMAARLFLYKLPRALLCGLWLVVLFRMACPVSVSLPVGLVPQGVADGSIAQFVLSSARPLAERRTQLQRRRQPFPPRKTPPPKRRLRRHPTGL